MVVKKSISNLFRSKTKSLLFLFLILALTIVLSLGLSVWFSVKSFLSECNDTYTTIAHFEYMGSEYPDETYYDQDMQNTISEFDFSIIENNENVLNWDLFDCALGYVEGYTRSTSTMPYGQSAILIVEDISSGYVENLYNATVKEAIYSNKDYLGSYFKFIPTYYSFENNYDNTHKYLIHGQFDYGKTSYPYFVITPFSFTAAKNAGVVDSDKYMVIDVTTDEGYKIPEDNIYQTIVETYKIVNNSVKVIATNDVSSQLPFHQQWLYITDGREFNEEEYLTDAKVCIVSAIFAKNMNLNIGDQIPLSIAICENASIFESYWGGTGFSYENTYEIVGITNTNQDFNNNVYIPKSTEIDFSLNHIGYTIGEATLNNDGADEFYNEIESQLPDRVRLTIYDQGYSNIAKPFKEILYIAIIVSAVSILVGLAVIILFGFLFVHRQRDVSDIMIKLGAGKGRVCRYFLYSSGLLAMVAVSVGSIVSYKLSSYIINLVNIVASTHALSDTRFSISNLTITKELAFNPNINYSFYVYIAIAVLLSTVICSLIFTINTFRKKHDKKVAKVKKIKVGHTLTLGGKAFKYSVLSILRGKMRTLVVPLIIFAAILFLSELAHTVDGYKSQLTNIKSTSIITGQFTDNKGKQVNNVLIEAYYLKDIYNSGYITDLNLSKATYCAYTGKYTQDENEFISEPFEIPSDSFALETFLANIKRGSQLIYTNSIQSSPEFFFSTNLTTEYLHGYDKSILSEKINGIPCCLVSTEFMEENKIELGDKIRLFVTTYFEQDIKDPTIDMLVVGSYVKESTKDNIYCQLSLYLDPSMLYDYKSDDNETLFDFQFDSANFIVTDASKLEEFKSFLYDYGFSSAIFTNTYRSFITIDDKKFNSTVDMLNQQIRYTNVLYPVLYTLVGIISLVVSYLLIINRRKELAIMRGLGASKNTAFLSLFIEQVFLCLIGATIGSVLCLFIYTSFTRLQLFLIVGFSLCYIIGSSISIAVMNNSTVLSMLKKED